jgi:hypothetical protein
VCWQRDQVPDTDGNFIGACAIDGTIDGDIIERCAPGNGGSNYDARHAHLPGIREGGMCSIVIRRKARLDGVAST